MKNVKLYYFEFPGRAEFIRVMLHYGKVPFEDVKFGFPEWGQTYKHKMPFGKVPVLEVDGVMLPESRAIGHYLGKQFHLNGKDDMEESQILALTSFMDDFANEIQKYISVGFGFAPGDKAKVQEEVFEPAAAKALPTFEKYLKESGNGFFFKGGVTWADFYISSFMAAMNRIDPGFFAKHPLLKENFDKVCAFPQVQGYLATMKKP